MSQPRHSSCRPDIAALAFGITIETLGHVLRTRELRDGSTIRLTSRDNAMPLEEVKEHTRGIENLFRA
jgi:hypothetical protein